MKGAQYFLVLIDKNGTVYRVFRNPITLRQMDERTTKYKNKTELVKTILANTHSYLNPKDIEFIEIWRQPNSKKEEYKKERGPLYKKDASVLNAESVIAKFEIMAMDKDFALLFAKRYSKVKNFKGLASEIEALVTNNVDYSEPFQELSEKVFSTYKGSRNAYFAMRKFENNKLKKVNNTKVDSIKDSIEYGKDLSEEEFEEVRLEYLIKYERELLDIDDFYNHQDISPFDAHKSK